LLASGSGDNQLRLWHDPLAKKAVRVLKTNPASSPVAIEAEPEEDDPRNRADSAGASYIYWHTHKLLEHQPMEDGFFDPGRRGVHAAFPSLHDLRHAPADSGREVIYVDTKEDTALMAFLERVKEALHFITDDRARAKRLAELVGEKLGGDLADIVQASDEDVARLNVKVVPLGQLRIGVCRHRAILYKLCADRVGLRCRLIRGDYHQGNHGGGHAWNVVLLQDKAFLCDVMHKAGHLYEEGSDKASHYKRLAERGEDAPGGGAGMGSIAPPETDPELAQLARFEVLPGDLEPCVDRTNKPIVLGEGGFGQVIKATLRGHAGFVAVKRVRPDRVSTNMQADFKRELVCLFGLRSNYVVQAVGFSSHPDDMFIALEFMLGGSLYNALHKSDDASWLRWDAAGKRVLEDVAGGLYYLHTRKPPIIHRDVKSPNVLLSALGGPSSVRAKLADVGSFKEKLQSSMSMENWGYTPVYAAPEVNMRRRQNEKVDIFAWGVLMWEVLSGRFPHSGYLEAPGGVSKRAVDLFERCRHEEPSQRPTSAELVSILRDFDTSN
jgi:hypothetical protein